ncbi:alpha-galactosidase [Fervidibacillus albus]|uniref:Alpha-galactosidase n=1 Tax=Fervidibacillus albus TaxID=2980026 RepID=A0A9E8LTV2_9BACI|nr:alpha-galactosidase [Fervidibacillus albus]WAA09275.1 alpha-galactosidase [Fervidibacillus albus]
MHIVTKNAAIYFNEICKEFHIQGKNFSYIFKILKNNQLGHIYFGKRVHHRTSFSHFFPLFPRANVTVQYEDSPEFSLELIKQEYPSYGTTDFREPAIQILQEDGSRITNFEYVSHRIMKGKPKLGGLPATYVEKEDEAITLEVVLYDQLIDTELRLLYTVFDEFSVLTRSAKIVNQGNQQLNITRIMSANIDFFDSEYEMVHLSGAWARERYVKRRTIEHGIQKISSTRGNASSPHHNPFIALKRPDATEHRGDVYGFSLVYSGNFLAQIEVDHYDVARVSIGINPLDFQWLLESGQSFQTPEAVIVYSDAGLNGMSQTFHELYRKRLTRGMWRDRLRPILINNWEATYFSFHEKKLLEIASVAKDLGVELFVLDDGWFGNRNDDTTSLGDWFPNKEKFPNGIAEFAKKINDMGLQFGLWIEPEMVSKNSRLYENHPDWLIHVPNRKSSSGRNQYVLDFSRPEVVDYIYEMVAKLFKEAPISYVKWDMNRYMTEIGSAALPAKRQWEVSHRYILGVYSLYERLTSAFPDILFESCAGGGGRFDPGMLYYAPQTWTSDNTDAVERLKIQYGTSYVYPLSSIGAHVSAVPNHQVNRVTSLDMRASVAYFGVFGYELDISNMSEQEKETMKKQILQYKRFRKLIQQGIFYRIISPFKGKGNVTAWMVVSEDQTEALVGYYQVLFEPLPGFKKLVLKGLNPQMEYEIEGMRNTYFGDELMNFGIVFDESSWLKQGIPGDFTSQLFYVKQKQ